MIRGNAMVGIAQIGRLKETIRRLSDLPRAVAVDVQPEIEKLLRKEFREGTDPYGRPWEPLAPATIARGRFAPPLTDTRALRNETGVTLRAGSRAGLIIKLGRPYGYFAQVGFRVGKTRVPPRRTLPQFGLPAAWNEVLRKAARRCAKRAVTR